MDLKKQLTYPCIIVERPHQRPGCAWTAECEEEITSLLAGNHYGDNWDSAMFDSPAAIEQVYGADRADWPEVLASLGPTQFPACHYTSPFGDWAGPESEADELAFALEYIGHDLSGLDVLESQAEAEALLKSGGHNMPYHDLRVEMWVLRWGADPDEQGADEEDT